MTLAMRAYMDPEPHSDETLGFHLGEIRTRKRNFDNRFGLRTAPKRPPLKFKRDQSVRKETSTARQFRQRKRTKAAASSHKPRAPAETRLFPESLMGYSSKCPSYLEAVMRKVCKLVIAAAAYTSAHGIVLAQTSTPNVTAPFTGLATPLTSTTTNCMMSCNAQAANCKTGLLFLQRPPRLLPRRAEL